MARTKTLSLTVVALHVHCRACGATARIVNDDYARRVGAGRAFWEAYHAPRLVSAEVHVAGVPRIVPIRTV